MGFEVGGLTYLELFERRRLRSVRYSFVSRGMFDMANYVVLRFIHVIKAIAANLSSRALLGFGMHSSETRSHEVQTLGLSNAMPCR